MKKFLLLLLVTGSLIGAARAAIQVGTSGFSETFASYPPTSDWTTTFIGTADTTYGNAAALDAGVQATAASAISTVLSNTTAASPTQIRWAIYSSANSGFIVTRPTGIGAVLLMATIQNAGGSTAHRLDVSYTLGATGTTLAEQIAAHRVYYSLDGSANSWVNLSSITTTAGPQSASIDLSATGWADGALLYLLWADDNATGGTDNGWSIDNLTLTTDLSNVPLGVTLTSPPTELLTTSINNPANVQLTATTVGTTAPTSVTFYTNGAVFFVDTVSPYSNQLVNLPVGTYTVYAKAVNATETAYSATNTVTVRDEFTHYTGGVLTETFDEMTSSGTVTPQGWYVGITPPINGTAVTVGDGSTGPNANILGWNYGLTGDSDRALGTAPTGADRSSVVRIQNNTSSNIVSFSFLYDGEVWRNYTNAQFGLTNEISYDLGTTWELTGTDYDFMQPFEAVAGTAGAINGNDPANRRADVGGRTITATTPIPPGGVLYIRWYDNNEGGTDGGLAVDNFRFQATGFTPATLFVNITSPAEGSTVAAACGATTANLTATASASFNVTNVTFTLDGTTSLADPAAPFSVTFNNLAIGSHRVVAFAQDSTGASVRATNNFTVSGNAGPTVAITNVFSLGTTGLVYHAGAAVTNQFGVADPDGIASIEFLVNGVRHFMTNVVFGQIVVNDLLAGTNTFTVRATDNCGNIGQGSVTVLGTNTPNVVMLVTNGSTWKYSSTGTEPPVDAASRPWTDPAYDDSTWLSGQGELGAGDAVTPPNTNPERTVIDIGPSGNRYHAVYFRHAFTVSNPSQITGLTVSALNDDGSAIYLNGTLIATFHMTNEVGVPITYADFAGPGAIGDDGTVYYSSNVVSSALVNGVNVLAVEVHQDAVGSSDLSFDLMLAGAPAGASGPRLTIVKTDATHATISWDASAIGFTLQSNTSVANPAGWSDVQAITSMTPITVSTATGINFYRLRQ